MLKQGIFITFEGGEGAGKTTLIEMMVGQLTQAGYSVLKTREPGGTKLGEQIRDLLLQQAGPVSPYAELCLFLASRAQHILEVIQPALQARKIVLCDRFNDSSVAYQGFARGLGSKQVSAFCQYISQDLKPHLTLYLDIEPELGLSRAAKVRAQDRIESENLAFHAKIREAFLKIHRAEPDRFRRIDATWPPSHVFQEAMKWTNALISSYV